ncbi:MAG: NADH-quinone oxidoreductase subunit N [Myxococcota bacterium]
MTALGNIDSLFYFAPESALTVGILVLIVYGLLARSASRVVAGGITLATLAASVAATALTADGESRLIFFGLFARDPFTDFFKYLFVLATAIVGIVAMRARDTIDYTTGRDPEATEFYALVLTVTLGMNMMAAATDLLTSYLSLELVSVMSYILSGFKKGDRKSAEASLKYVIYGGVASGVMLYGLSLLYGMAGATDLASVRAAGTQAGLSPALFLGVSLSLAGFGYKIASVPFHMWCPDVYEGAPTPVTAFLSVGPKAAGFALLIRFFGGAVPGEALLPGAPWPLLMGLISAATMTLGNLAALGQTSIKRLFAYSSIAHAGYLLMGFCVFSTAGTEAILLYLVVYLFMNLGAFLVVIALEEAGLGEQIDGYRGLGERSPLVAALMAIFLFSLTGIPPLAGFVGKFYIFTAVVARGGTFFVTLAIIGVLNSAVSLYYYARILRTMYLEKPEAGAPAIVVAPIHRAVALAMVVPTIILGIYWTPVLRVVDASLKMFGG